MSKRFSGSSLQSSKKPKVDEDFWDDDFDADELDDIFEKATQVAKRDEAQCSNVVSTYSVFKRTDNFITSTQNSQAFDHVTAEDRVKELQSRYAEKEGEVSILRSNLQSLKTSCQEIDEKKEQEWKTKLNALEKENGKVKSELEFKTLEIINLRGQLAELAKAVNAGHNQSPSSTIPHKKVRTTISENTPQAPASISQKIYVHVDECYPLKMFSFKSKEFAKYLKNYSAQTSKQNFKPDDKAKDALSVDLAEMDQAYEDLLVLTECSSGELNSDRCIKYIDKAVILSFQLLAYFYRQLKENRGRAVVQENRPFENSGDKVLEASILCSEILDFLKELVPFSDHLKHMLFLEQAAYSLNVHEILMKLERRMLEGKENPSNFLSLMACVVSSIAELNLQTNCDKFIVSAIRLLFRLFSSEDLNTKEEVIKEICNAILLLRSSVHVFDQINILLNVMATRSNNFIDYVCTARENEKKDTCFLYNYVIASEGCLKTLKDEELTKFNVNVLNLTYNVFKCNNIESYQHEHRRCECISRLCKFAVRCMLQETSETDYLNKKHLTQNGTKILNLLVFSGYDMTQRYVKDIAQFKEVVFNLVRTDENVAEMLKSLDKLTTTEDIPKISKEKFLSIRESL